jgi:hypothetical protein
LNSEPPEYESGVLNTRLHVRCKYRTRETKAGTRNEGKRKGRNEGKEEGMKDKKDR